MIIASRFLLLFFFLSLSAGIAGAQIVEETLSEIDQDGDLIPDAVDSDRDGDGVDNSNDVFPDDSSEWADTDGDSVGDNSDNCPENANSGQADQDSDGVGDVCDSDRDGDSLPNDWEDAHGLNADDPHDAQSDADSDGLTALQEYGLSSDPNNSDSDDDGVVDGIDPTPTEKNQYLIVDRLVVGSSFKTFSYSKTGSVVPVVMPGVPSRKDVSPGVMRLRNISTSKAEARFQEWDYLDSTHPEEEVGFMALTPGRYPQNDGALWEVGTVDLRGTTASSGWVNVEFQEAHSAVPVVFAIAQTYEGAEAVAVRLNNVTKTGFDVAFQEQEATIGDHNTEILGYIAVSSPGNSGSIRIEDATGKLIGNVSYSLSKFNITHSLKKVGIEYFWYQEEQSRDDEVAHTTETAGLLDISGQSFVQVQTYRGADPAAMRRALDADLDDVPDYRDNCRDLSNTDQADLDNDNIGDLCDDDRDGDGVLNPSDVYPDDPEEWADSDEDGVGDNGDNCPSKSNSGQADHDGDGIGNVCDSDKDNDGHKNWNDAFPYDATEWSDMDGDGIGDNSDPDRDGDGVANTDDAFPSDPSESQDSDNDGVGDNSDNCRNKYNASQADIDADGVGDPCDPDRDGDGYSNSDDAFPNNPGEWLDTDGDGSGNNSDNDIDGDGITNEADADQDGDGLNDDDDAFPKDHKEWSDIDGDGLGDRTDDDRDGDGKANSSDASPDDLNAINCPMGS